LRLPSQPRSRHAYRYNLNTKVICAEQIFSFYIW
jgi:hypothetical protein